MKTLQIATHCFFVFTMAGTAAAGGLYVPGSGSQAQARAGAFVAKADDPSATWHNPAGLSKTTGTQLHIGVNALDLHLAFTRAGRYEPTINNAAYEDLPYPRVENQADPAFGFAGIQTTPMIAVSTDFGRPDSKFRFGFGLFAPHAYGSRDFAEQVDLGGGILAPAPQRYDSTTSSSTAAFPSVGVSYSPIPELDIGLRLSWGFAQVKAVTTIWGLRNPEEDPRKDGNIDVTAADNFVPTFGLGILYRPFSWLELGGAYSSQANISARGDTFAAFNDGVGAGGVVDTLLPPPAADALCESGGVLGALKTCIEVALPRLLTLGARLIKRNASGEEIADLEFDVRWENWGARCAVTGRFAEVSGFTSRGCIDPLVQVDTVSNLTGILGAPAFSLHGFKDTWSFRLGGSHKFRIKHHRLEARAGLAYDTAAADLTWTRLDNDGKERATFAAGLGYSVGRWSFDLGVGYVYEPDRDVPACRPPYGPTSDVAGCLDNGQETPIEDRVQPDVTFPLNDAETQVENPFNAGLHQSSYLLWSVGITARFK